MSFVYIPSKNKIKKGGKYIMNMGLAIGLIAAALVLGGAIGFLIRRILAEKKIAPFRFIRIATDLICVAVGWLFGYLPGVGTVLTAFCMGPLISVFNEKIAKPMLYGKEKTADA